MREKYVVGLSTRTVEELANRINVVIETRAKAGWELADVRFSSGNEGPERECPWAEALVIFQKAE